MHCLPNLQKRCSSATMIVTERHNPSVVGDHPPARCSTDHKSAYRPRLIRDLAGARAACPEAGKRCCLLPGGWQMPQHVHLIPAQAVKRQDGGVEGLCAVRGGWIDARAEQIWCSMAKDAAVPSVAERVPSPPSNSIYVRCSHPHYESVSALAATAVDRYA